MKMIEEGLNQVHEDFQSGNNISEARARSNHTNGHASSFHNSVRSEMPSFAIIEHVQDGSPADIAVSDFF